ncbi:zinc finger protein NUTCRACKER-like [Pyrus ussuriensis x Pyrus communis]|uniref:Zinc finger protein NUTCRACKER-like n=1 Tax=Pyrus ussuriensis x Pyrus communis TaxID=2448454 RepID=A0A5N5I6W3_9ROSA|nr:zinc finger protein NUTCRACKER-like [Pyrus ussuriensis x Pyrus communis]
MVRFSGVVLVLMVSLLLASTGVQSPASSPAKSPALSPKQAPAAPSPSSTAPSSSPSSSPVQLGEVTEEELKQRTSKEVRKRVYVCPETSCVHNNPTQALGDLTGIKKHFCRKHGEKKWQCERCSKKYAVQSDWKAHMKTCKYYRAFECGFETAEERKQQQWRSRVGEWRPGLGRHSRSTRPDGHGAKIAEMEAASTGEAARLGATLETVKGELAHLKREHEKEKESWEAASGS